MRRLLAAMSLLVACSHGGADSDDPMRALASPAVTTKYGHAYWLNQARERTALWDSAYVFCSAYWPHADGSRPNCGNVYTANFQNAGATAPIRGKDMSVDANGFRP